MGLDMYLTKRTYVKNWAHMQPEQLVKISLKGSRAEHIKPKRICEIVEDIAYWRKANSIHNWFVKNVQKGVDDCGTYHVPMEKLKELLELAKEVVRARTTKTKTERAKQLIPTVSGFFFGSDDYDEYYFEDINYTIKVLTETLKEPVADYYYHASW